MSNTKPYLFGAVLGASAMYVALQYHVVHSHDGFQMVPRTPQHSVGLAYADVRNWSPSQWTDRPELARALMAHGSADLISESVAHSLADSVIEENSTLDQLRSFLDKPTFDGAKGNSGTLFEIPVPIQAPANADSSAEDELTRIPFPQDAKNSVVADPFRVAQGAESTAPDFARPPATVQSPSRPAGTPRFSAADVIEGLRDNPAEPMDSFSVAAPQPTFRTNAADRNPTAARSSAPASTAEQAQAMEDRIFGKSSSTTANSGAPALSESDSMFEEVTTQLENRAQAALNRARESTANTTSANKSGGPKNTPSTSPETYIRRRIEDAAPEALKSVIKNAPAENTEKSADSLLDRFDPFLE